QAGPGGRGKGVAARARSRTGQSRSGGREERPRWSSRGARPGDTQAAGPIELAMARFILWAILLTVLLRSLSRLMHGILEGAGYSRGTPPHKSVGLVRDPVCGVFVVPGQ